MEIDSLQEALRGHPTFLLLSCCVRRGFVLGSRLCGFCLNYQMKPTESGHKLTSLANGCGHSGLASASASGGFKEMVSLSICRQRSFNVSYAVFPEMTDICQNVRQLTFVYFQRTDGAVRYFVELSDCCRLHCRG